jgi:hypothetical protein
MGGPRLMDILTTIRGRDTRVVSVGDEVADIIEARDLALEMIEDAAGDITGCAALLEAAIYSVTRTFVTDADEDDGRGPYALAFDPGAASHLEVHVNGEFLLPGEHFTVVAMEGSSSGVGMKFVDDMPMPTGHTVAYTMNRFLTTVIAPTDAQFAVLPEEFGADTVAGDNSGALNLWAAASPYIKVPLPERTYRITSAFIIPAGEWIDYRLNLIWAGGNNLPVLTVGAGAHFEEIVLTNATATGLTATMAEDVTFKSFTATSSVEIASSFLTAHPTITGERVITSKFTRPLVLDGQPDDEDFVPYIPGVIDPGTDFKNPAFVPGDWTRPGGGRIDYMDASTLSRGVRFIYVDGFSFGHCRLHGRATGTLGEPGDNGWLMAGTSNIRCDHLIVENAKEHGLRIGGEWAQVACSDIWIGKYETLRPYESHFKINGNADYEEGDAKPKAVTKNIQIDDMMSYGDTAGGNAEFLRITAVDGLHIGKATLRLADGASVSCAAGLSLDGATDVQIGRLDLEGHSGHAIQTDAEQDGSNPGGDVTNINIGFLRAVGGNDVLHIDTEGDGDFAAVYADIGDFHIHDGIFEPGDSLISMDANSPFTGPVTMRGRLADGTTLGAVSNMRERPLLDVRVKYQGGTLINRHGALDWVRDMPRLDLPSRVSEYYCTNTTSTYTSFATPTTVGTATARNINETNFENRYQRLGLVSSASAGNGAEWYLPANFYIGRNSAAKGGYWAKFQFLISDASLVTGARMFIGMLNAAGALGNTDPTSLTKAIGVGHGASETTMRLYYGGTSAQTPIDLGAGFPVANDVAYEFELWANGSEAREVQYCLKRLESLAFVRGSISGTGVQVPDVDVKLSPRMMRTNNATASAVGLDIIYIAAMQDI